MKKYTHELSFALGCGLLALAVAGYTYAAVFLKVPYHRYSDMAHYIGLFAIGAAFIGTILAIHSWLIMKRGEDDNPVNNQNPDVG